MVDFAVAERTPMVNVDMQNCPFSAPDGLMTEAALLAPFAFGAFHGTDLELILRLRGIDAIIIAGIPTNVCCETTARKATVRDFHVFFLSDGDRDLQHRQCFDCGASKSHVRHARTAVGSGPNGQGDDREDCRSYPVRDVPAFLKESPQKHRLSQVEREEPRRFSPTPKEEHNS
jgi:hypothetical protein